MKFISVTFISETASAIGSLTNPEKLKNTFRTVKKFKITSSTIKKYLDYFEDSFLIEAAGRYNIIIYNELRMRDYNVDVGIIPVSEKDKNGKVIKKQLKVDFVCNLGSARYYIQSAYSLPDEAKRTQEIRPFRKIDDSFKKIVVTKDIIAPYYDEYGILTMNIYDFLLNPRSLEQ